MRFEIIRPGLLTSVQDLGRIGMQKHGVIVSGAMDSFAHRAANILVGNEESAAALEITMQGPTLKFTEDSLIAVCGGEFSVAIAEKQIPGWRSIFVKKGSVLTIGAAKSGCRAYLSVAGGFAIPKVLDSRSTYLRAEIGGFKGRALKKGDVLDSEPPTAVAAQIIRLLRKKAEAKDFAVSDWSVSKGILPVYQSNPLIRIIRGGQYHWFTAESRDRFKNEEFLVTTQSDRMGYRLSGPLLQLSERKELVSEAVTAGTIQVPADGNPIILLADRQTTGGYPKIAEVATVDLPVLAQVKPGDKVRFQEIRLDEAQQLLRLRESKLKLLKQGIKLKNK